MSTDLRPRANREPNDGTKWADKNHELKQELKDKNNGSMPETLAFTTSELKNDAAWSEKNLPEVLFYLQPPLSEHGNAPEALQDGEGNLIKNEEVSPLRDTPILPKRISVDDFGWMMMAWRRTDPRITFQIIIDSMTTDLGAAHETTNKVVQIPTKNALQNRCMRNCRKLLTYYHDYGRRESPHRAEVEAIGKLSFHNIEDNTNLTRHPMYQDRLVKKKVVRQNADGNTTFEDMTVTESNLEESTFAREHFRKHVLRCNPEVTHSMQKAVMLLWNLQDGAVRHGHHPDQ